MPRDTELAISEIDLVIYSVPRLKEEQMSSCVFDDSLGKIGIAVNRDLFPSPENWSLFLRNMFTVLIKRLISFSVYILNKNKWEFKQITFAALLIY